MIRHATLRALPRPDRAEYAWAPARVGVILGEPGPLAAALGKRLVARGWRVEVVAPGVAEEPAALAARLAALGPVGALISLAPRRVAPATASVADALLGDPRDEAWLLTQFRIARQLSAALHAPGADRAWFVAVTRLDGRLGLAPTPRGAGVVVAGVHGLVKSLRLEWPAVFCRAIDLHPALDAAFAAERIVDELHDPDRTLGEVGHDAAGRWTIATTGAEVDVADA